MSKINVTAIIIAKNEEGMIADCLDSLQFCSEVLVVDNGSSDNTAEIAKRMGARVIVSRVHDFSKLRMEGLRHAGEEWVLYVDADERITPELVVYLRRAISKENIVAYKLWRKNFYFGEYEWPFIESLERLFRKEYLEGWHGIVHETPIVKGAVEQLDGFILHYTHRDLTSMLRKTIEWSQIEAKLRFDSGHPLMTWWRFPRVMFTAFFDSYIRQQGWRLGVVGFIESTYQGFSMFITYARLWEMQSDLNSSKSKN